MNISFSSVQELKLMNTKIMHTGSGKFSKVINHTPK